MGRRHVPKWLTPSIPRSVGRLADSSEPWYARYALFSAGYELPRPQWTSAWEQTKTSSKARRRPIDADRSGEAYVPQPSHFADEEGHAAGREIGGIGCSGLAFRRGKRRLQACC